ncbi:MAG: glutamine--tRNA ligase [Proteobacteria bacterium]|nr:MAG: glutamine--tRNA ligase [Pseudomonadota bacterium]
MSANDTKADEARQSTNFIRQIIDRDLTEARYGGAVVTRFPPEPNGYLHIGHAKSICLNFGLARDYDGACHLRFDDTNPVKEEQEYVDSIRRDVRWLGFDWGDNLFFASDYFDRMYALAQQLIRDGKAYVDSQTKEEIRAGRGSLKEPGVDSPYRGRSTEDNLRLFDEMRRGEHPEGAHVLRAKGDMASPNMLMRDPLLYRIVHARHHRAGDAWCIYPMYDYAHCLEDAIEGITHSICTLEFENNRELYDWVLDNTGWQEPRPHQYEFARLALEYTVMSKRKLLQLVAERHVSGWDDPRMPTIAGMRRRGITPEAIRDFAELVGVAKTNSTVDIGKLEYCIRNDLNHRAPRVMAVLDPLKVVLTNYPEDQVEALPASYWPHDVPKEGTRQVPFSRELYIERGDFCEAPPKGFYRLAPGREVRLRYGYYITCDEVVRDAAGEVVELRCSYDPATRGGASPDGRKVRGTLHWVSAAESLPAEVRLYDRLFSVPNPGSGDVDFLTQLNPESLVVVQARVEPSLGAAAPGSHFQFERQGYFFADPDDHGEGGALVFNRVVTLKDSWAKRRTRGAATAPAATAPAATAPAATAPATTAPERTQGGGGDRGRTRPDKRSRAEVRAKLRAADPSLKAAYQRLRAAHGLSEEDADVLSGDAALVAFFEEAAAGRDAASVAKWLVNVLMAEIKERAVTELPFGGEAFGALVALVDADVISSTAAKTVLDEMVAGGGEPAALVDSLGLRQLDDRAALRAVIDELMTAHPDNVARYRQGNRKLRGFFVGQVMRATQGKANPKLVQELLTAALDGEPASPDRVSSETKQA